MHVFMSVHECMCMLFFIAFKLVYWRNHTIRHIQIKYEVSRFQVVEHVRPFFLGWFHTLVAPFRCQPRLYQLLLHLLIVKCNLPNESAGCELQQSVL